jgi:hypothetical protein
MICSVTDTPCPPTPADPASHDPSEARPATCAYWDGTRRPDPTDRYMAMLDRCAELGMALIEKLAAEAEEMIAARRAAAAAKRPAAEAAVPAAAEPPPAEPAPAEPATGAEAGPAEPELTVEQHVARDPSYLAFQRLTRSLHLCMSLALRFHNDRLDREAGLVKGRAAAAAAAPQPPRERSPKEQLADRVKDKIEREAKPEEKEILLSELRERLDEEDVERDLQQYPIDELALLICQDLGAGPDGNFKGMGTLVFEYLLVEPPPQPGEPAREEQPPEIYRREEPRPLHIIRAMNRRNRRAAERAGDPKPDLPDG